MTTNTETCTWRPPCDPEYGFHEASCGFVFTFIEDGIEENHFKYCPSCGGSIREGHFDKDGNPATNTEREE